VVAEPVVAIRQHRRPMPLVMPPVVMLLVAKLLVAKLLVAKPLLATLLLATPLLAKLLLAMLPAEKKPRANNILARVITDVSRLPGRRLFLKNSQRTERERGTSPALFLS